MTARSFVELSLAWGPGAPTGRPPLQTSVKMGTYNAVFGEHFSLPVDPPASAASGHEAELVLSVMDWDRLGRNELVGTVRISLGGPGGPGGPGGLGGPGRERLSAGYQCVYKLVDGKGAVVRGHDKQVRLAFLSISLSLCLSVSVPLSLYLAVCISVLSLFLPLSLPQESIRV